MFELLNILSISLPFVIMITSVLDVLLAGVYLKWFHPWKIILQEVFSSFLFVLYNFLQEPDSWQMEEDEEEGMDQGKKNVNFQQQQQKLE